MSDKPVKVDESKLERRRWGKRPSYPFVDANGVLVTSNRRRAVEVRELPPEDSGEQEHNTEDQLNPGEVSVDQFSIESLANDSSEFFVEDPQAITTNNQAGLTLSFKKWSLSLAANDTSCSVGRDDTCDLVMPNRFASRRHGRIEWREDCFYFCDHSFNGTYIEFDNGKKVHICRDEVRLDSSGKISLGKPTHVEKDFIIQFKSK